jgi:hypothetical protein
MSATVSTAKPQHDTVPSASFLIIHFSMSRLDCHRQTLSDVTRTFTRKTGTADLSLHVVRKIGKTLFSNCFQFWLLDLHKTTMLWVLKQLLPYLLVQQKRKKMNANRELLYTAEKVHILLL